MVAQARSTNVPGLKVVGGSRIEIPDTRTFGAEVFIPAPELLALANKLRDRHEMPTEITLDVLWKREGGKSRGHEVWSKTSLATSGILGFYSPADVVIWVAADHLAKRKADNKLFEALLFGELCRIGFDDNLKPVLNPPDFAGFKRELEHYGLWRQDLEGAAEAFEQARMFVP